ncbi:MAG: acyl-ACP--UDP-N-acetylglucosamine O-acyltransferase [Rhodobacteraceae bacterium]|nr:acyl-ACP--UDP-N-acetylglucosamine O-acyltransferase [Paracoccaceae bacterium]
MEPQIHPSAVIEAGARIGPGCRIGPFAIIGPEVTLADGVEVKSHAVVTGWTDVGAGSVIFPFACVGEVPQDLKYAGERTRLIVGARCRIREGATLNTGTAGGGGVTRVGDDCLLMTGVHIGHDAQVGNGVIMANQVAIGGHAVIADKVVIGGLSGVHQFVRIGTGAMIGAVLMVAHDVLPYAMVRGPRGEVDGLNLVGLKRRGASREELRALRDAYDALAAPERSLQDTAQALLQSTGSPHVREIAAFIAEGSDRAFLKPK